MERPNAFAETEALERLYLLAQERSQEFDRMLALPDTRRKKWERKKKGDLEFANAEHDHRYEKNPWFRLWWDFGQATKEED